MSDKPTPPPKGVASLPDKQRQINLKERLHELDEQYRLEKEDIERRAALLKQ